MVERLHPPTIVFELLFVRHISTIVIRAVDLEGANDLAADLKESKARLKILKKNEMEGGREEDRSVDGMERNLGVGNGGGGLCRDFVGVGNSGGGLQHGSVGVGNGGEGLRRGSNLPNHLG